MSHQSTHFTITIPNKTPTSFDVHRTSPGCLDPPLLPRLSRGRTSHPTPSEPHRPPRPTRRCSTCRPTRSLRSAWVPGKVRNLFSSMAAGSAAKYDAHGWISAVEVPAGATLETLEEPKAELQSAKELRGVGRWRQVELVFVGFSPPVR